MWVAGLGWGIGRRAVVHRTYGYVWGGSGVAESHHHRRSMSAVRRGSTPSGAKRQQTYRRLWTSVSPSNGCGVGEGRTSVDATVCTPRMKM